ncbi:hypothetical protein F0562_011393 [Nyssa sinensis]|uniref:Uncharacterized protein n=1 Tax=Nyssa sinensis TaxID=561372 RepID=A0A5J5A3Q1_9ASTE|nr:hypothetical protein F0562_011393 [Nyssa sinensis]
MPYVFPYYRLRQLDATEALTVTACVANHCPGASFLICESKHIVTSVWRVVGNRSDINTVVGKNQVVNGHIGNSSGESINGLDLELNKSQGMDAADSRE